MWGIDIIIYTSITFKTPSMLSWIFERYLNSIKIKLFIRIYSIEGKFTAICQDVNIFSELKVPSCGPNLTQFL